MAVTGSIERISYTPYLGSTLPSYSWSDLSTALLKETAFTVRFIDGIWAISKWVSPKRSRSFPFARVYDTYAIDCKRITVIPIFKDEGKSSGSGDRDFVQWDTISLMSLLNVYVILSYYESAEPNLRYPGKITNQRFCINHLSDQFLSIRKYHSSALHWNMDQTSPDNIKRIGDMAVKSYEGISRKLGTGSHSKILAMKKIHKMSISREKFMSFSRTLAKHAQEREVVTIQPKEAVSGKKDSITIRNYLGGEYYLTLDELEAEGDRIMLIEAKHTKKGVLPSMNSIKDGLMKMILFSNLTQVFLDNKKVQFQPVLKLTSLIDFDSKKLNKRERRMYELLVQEAEMNHFTIRHVTAI